MPPMPSTKGCGRVGCYGPVVELPGRMAGDMEYMPGRTCLGCCAVDAIPEGMVPEWRPDPEAVRRRLADALQPLWWRLTSARTSA